MNITKTFESLNSLINKKQRKRKSRHNKFLKQQKRTLTKTLKQDKMYRQQLHNIQEDMFNSTITRMSKKTKKKEIKYLDLQNDTTIMVSDDTFESTQQRCSPIRDSGNVTIVISKVVIEPSGDGESNKSTWMENRPKCSDESIKSEFNLNQRNDENGK